MKEAWPPPSSSTLGGHLSFSQGGQRTGTPLTNTGGHAPPAGPGSAEWRWLSPGSCSLPSVSVLPILSVALVPFYDLLAPPERSGHQGWETAESVAMHSEAGPCNGPPRSRPASSLPLPSRTCRARGSVASGWRSCMRKLGF